MTWRSIPYPSSEVTGFLPVRTYAPLRFAGLADGLIVFLRLLCRALAMGVGFPLEPLPHQKFRKRRNGNWKNKSTVPEEISEGALIRCKTTALCRKRQQAIKPWGGVKEAPILDQVKYLMHFCVRKLRVFLRFCFTDLLQSDQKYYPKYRHLHL